MAMTRQEGRKLALILDDELDGIPEQNLSILERLRRDFPELTWDVIQHNPPIFMVDEPAQIQATWWDVYEAWSRR
jgi:hypothetical protein